MERSNGVGRLVKKEPPRPYPTWTAPASFTLHEGNFSSTGSSSSPSCAAIRLTAGWSSRWSRSPRWDRSRALLDSVATPSCCIWRNRERGQLWIPKEGYRNARIEAHGARMAIGQGRRLSPPEPFIDQGGPPHAGPSSSTNLSRASARGTKGSIPSKASVNQKHVCKAGGVSIAGQFGSLCQSTIPRLPVPSLAQIQSSRSSHKGSDYGASPCRRRIRGKPERTR